MEREERKGILRGRGRRREKKNGERRKRGEGDGEGPGKKEKIEARSGERGMKERKIGKEEMIIRETERKKVDGNSDGRKGSKNERRKVGEAKGGRS